MSDENRNDESPIKDPTEHFAQIEGTILLWLTTDDQRPWSVEEVIREHGNRLQATDAIDALVSVGLLHRTIDDFVFATRAAIRAEQIAQ
jgi:hypothetical protein